MPIDKKYVINRQGKDMVLYGGLLDAAHGMGLQSITTELIQIPNAENGQVAIVRARVSLEAEGKTKHFDGIGDADRENVSKMMLPHLIRMAETRAKARALRDAINVGEALVDDPTDQEEPEAPPQRAQRSQPPKGLEAAMAAVAKAPQKSPLELYDALVARVIDEGYEQKQDGELIAFTDDALPEHIRPEYDRLRLWLKAKGA